MKNLEENENNKNEIDSLDNILDNISIINKTVFLDCFFIV